MFRETLVPVRNPFWIPTLNCWNWFTRAFVPVTNVELVGVVWWEASQSAVSTGSRLGIFDPANCTLRPLRTPPCPATLLAFPLTDPAPSELAFASTPNCADEGP